MRVQEKTHKTQFIEALHAQKKVRVKFLSKEDKSSITRVCAPMDYGPSRRAKVDQIGSSSGTSQAMSAVIP